MIKNIITAVVALGSFISPVFAQTAFTYPAGCNAPAFNLTSNEPKVGGATMIDDVSGNIGDFIGIFNASGDLLGQGEVGVIVNGSTSSIGFLTSLQTDAQGMGCPVFTNGEVITVKISTAAGVLIAPNSTFPATIGPSFGLVDGPDGMPFTVDTFNFLGASLPVSLSNFTATTNEDAVNLNWSTATESDNSYFEVQRAVTPAAGFEKIGTVVGNGTTTEATAYDFTDRNPGEGMVYYRLLQVDGDGTSAYSPIVVAELEVSADREVAIFPNPATAGGRLTVRLNGPWTNGGAELQLLDATGRKVAGWNGLSNGSLNTVLPVVQAGVYQLVATDGNERRITRVVVR